MNLLFCGVPKSGKTNLAYYISSNTETKVVDLAGKTLPEQIKELHRGKDQGIVYENSIIDQYWHSILFPPTQKWQEVLKLESFLKDNTILICVVPSDPEYCKKLATKYNEEYSSFINLYNHYFSLTKFKGKILFQPDKQSPEILSQLLFDQGKELKGKRFLLAREENND